MNIGKFKGILAKKIQNISPRVLGLSPLIMQPSVWYVYVQADLPEKKGVWIPARGPKQAKAIFDFWTNKERYCRIQYITEFRLPE